MKLEQVMISIFSFRATPIVQVLLVMLTVCCPQAYGEPPNGRALDNLPLSRECITGATIQRLRTSVRWNEDHYDVETGIAVLMGVVRNPDTGVHERELAIIRLASLGPQLEGRPCLGYLGTIYDNAGMPEKRIILTCFLGSGDPRGIPLFFRTLDKEEDMKLRLSAAGGLAGWNVRRGVAEVVRLLESNETLPQPARMPYVRDNALRSFRTKNRLRGWGFPDEKLRKSILDRPGLDREEFVASYTAAIKKWFTEN